MKKFSLASLVTMFVLALLLLAPDMAAQTTAWSDSGSAALLNNGHVVAYDFTGTISGTDTLTTQAFTLNGCTDKTELRRVYSADSTLGIKIDWLVKNTSGTYEYLQTYIADDSTATYAYKKDTLLFNPNGEFFKLRLIGVTNNGDDVEFDYRLKGIK